MARSLWPREHGAYVQLLVPLAVASIANGVTLVSALFAAGACAAFGANESLLVVLGHRGRRARELMSARARRFLAVLLAIAFVAGIVGFVLATPNARAMAIAVLVPAALVVWFAWRRRERTIAGELAAAVALTGAATPVAVAAGMPWSAAAALWAAWVVGYGCTVLAVHHVIAIHKRRETSRVAIVSALAVASCAAAVAAPVALVATPLTIASAGIAIAQPSATRLRAIGFAMLGASLIAGAFAIIAR